MKLSKQPSQSSFKGLEQTVTSVALTWGVTKGATIVFGGIGSLLFAALYWAGYEAFIEKLPLRSLVTHAGLQISLLAGFVMGLLVARLLYKRNNIRIV
ncbi:MAG: hypothetical protein DI585_06175 [Pseudomonas fluorescens]|nr:MAG: hypothetical protein DI585_06175 [Pseudomonas fluorescens]